MTAVTGRCGATAPVFQSRASRRKQHRDVVPGHDQAGTRVSFATSEDGVNWSEPGDLSGPPRIDGYGWIARGYWVREGQLLALARPLPRAWLSRAWAQPRGPSAGNRNAGEWVAHGRVLDDAINNFPPKRLPNGLWMMSRRDHLRQVTMVVGGVKGFDQWENPFQWQATTPAGSRKNLTGMSCPTGRTWSG